VAVRRAISQKFQKGGVYNIMKEAVVTFRAFIKPAINTRGAKVDVKLAATLAIAQ